MRATPTVSLTAPTGLTGVGGAGTIRLSWNVVPNALGYDIQQWHSASRSWRILPSGSYTVAVSGTAATVGGLRDNTTYYHQVRAAPFRSGAHVLAGPLCASVRCPQVF